MIVNNEDYYYLPGVAKAIKDILGREDLVKMDVPELLVQLGYDYDANTIPYETQGKTISLYKKSSIPELLDMPGNRNKANMLIARLSAKRTAQQKNINMFGINRSRPNRRSFVTESLNSRRHLNEELKFDVTLKNHIPKRIIKIYRDINDHKKFIVYDGSCYYSADCNTGIIMVCINQNTKNLVNYVVKKLKQAYNNHNLYNDITCANGRVKIKYDKRGRSYRRDVIDWMEDKGFVYDINVSYDEYLEFYLRWSCCDDTEVLKSYEDCTDLILKHAWQLNPEMLIKNLDCIYNHIMNRDTVFEVGDIKDDGVCPPCVVPVGRLREEYPKIESRTLSLGMRWDKRFRDQQIIGYGMLPGVYKCECKGKPCTMIVREKKNDDMRTQGIIYYNDDNINPKDYL